MVATASIAGALFLAACSKGSQSGGGAPGAQVYAANCASCHQANGQGAAGAFPPLAGSNVVNGDASRVIHIVKYGLTGRIVIGGTTYDGQMPAWSGKISDPEIASVITYVRSSWGNKASAVAPSQVITTSQ